MNERKNWALTWRLVKRNWWKLKKINKIGMQKSSKKMRRQEKRKLKGSMRKKSPESKTERESKPSKSDQIGIIPWKVCSKKKDRNRLMRKRENWRESKSLKRNRLNSRALLRAKQLQQLQKKKKLKSKSWLTWYYTIKSYKRRCRTRISIFRHWVKKLTM